VAPLPPHGAKAVFFFLENLASILLPDSPMIFSVVFQRVQQRFDPHAVFLILSKRCLFLLVGNPPTSLVYGMLGSLPARQIFLNIENFLFHNEGNLLVILLFPPWRYLPSPRFFTNRDIEEKLYLPPCFSLIVFLA